MSVWNIQAALYSALSGNISATVYDHVPEDSSFPYVVIGEDMPNQWDTDTEQGFETVLTLHFWSRYRGKKEVKELTDEVYDLLHRKSLAISGQYTVNLMWESSEILLDPDGLTYHGLADYRLISEST